MSRRRANRETLCWIETDFSVSKQPRTRSLDSPLVSLHFHGTLDPDAVPSAVQAVSALVTRPEVAAAWEQESACAGMTVGGLTRHLISQADLVVSLLQADPAAGADAEVIEVMEHYARAAWVREDLDGETNTTIRSSSDEQAAAGVDVALDVLSRARSRLDAALAAPPPTTYIPWQGWALATDDFLVTRLMEMVVHSDDLAASVDVPPPAFDDAVLDPVLHLLTAVSLRRHGQDALVRTLSRPQRAPDAISAF